jgi:hypothetical protein
VLLGEGRATYGREIRRGYLEAGFDDIPELGPRLLGGIRRHGGTVGSVSDVARDFGISKQAASDRLDRELEKAVGAKAVARCAVGALVALREA